MFHYQFFQISFFFFEFQTMKIVDFARYKILYFFSLYIKSQANASLFGVFFLIS